MSADYSLRDVGKLLGLPRSIICGLIDAGPGSDPPLSAYRKLSKR